MKTSLFTLLTLSLGLTPLLAESHKAWTLAAEVFAATEPAETDHSPKAMVDAAKAFLDSLTDAERKQALLPINDPERKQWTNVPPRGDVGGIRLGDLTKPQLEKACAFLSTVLSKQGYLKSRNIMLADDLLLKSKEKAEARGGFGSANFWVAIFGAPSESEPWAVQWDGHHVAVNITIKGDDMTASPSFIGTQPHKFTLGDEEIVPMKNEVAWAFDFVNSLTAKQRTSAIQSDRRGRMQAGAGKDGFKPDPRGLSCKDLTDEQRKGLMKLISVWVNDMPRTAAEARLKDIESQLDKAFFAWNGPYKPGSDASYHLFGPNVIIEYCGQDLGGNPHDHLHSIYRDPTNEYGAKLLAK